MKKYAELILMLALLVFLYRENEGKPLYKPRGQYRSADDKEELLNCQKELQERTEELLACREMLSKQWTELLLWKRYYKDYKNRTEDLEEMYWAENSLERIYLIQSPYELEEVCRLVRNGEAIDRGVWASSASYQLAADIYAFDWMMLGSENEPFLGTLDGGGHSITGAFALKGEQSFITAGSLAVIKDLKIKNTATEESSIRISLGSAADVRQYSKILDQCPDGGLEITLQNLGTKIGSLEPLMKAIEEVWQKNGEKDGFYSSLSVAEYPQREEGRNGMRFVMQSLRTLFDGDAEDDECSALREQGSCPGFFRLERIGELNCLIFATGQERYDTCHILLQGKWEGQEVSAQSLCVPIADEQNEWDRVPRDLSIMIQDIDFDGREDLLLRLGVNHRSGRKRAHYIGIVWDETGGRFSHMDSFPEFVSFLEFDRQRMVSLWWSEEKDRYRIDLYAFRNGQYEESKGLELIRDQDCSVYGADSVTINTYHKGELVDSRDFSDEWKEEFAGLYPEWVAYMGEYENGWFSIGW